MTRNARLTSPEGLSQPGPPTLTAREQQVCRWLRFLVDNPSSAGTPEAWVSRAARILQGAGPYRIDVVLAAVFTDIWTNDQPGAYATRMFTVEADWLTTVRASGPTQMLSALAAAAVDPRLPRGPERGWYDPGKRRKKGKREKQGRMDTDH